MTSPASCPCLRSLAFAVALGIAGPSVAAYEQATYGDEWHFDTKEQLSAVEVADVTGDGLPDVIAASLAKGDSENDYRVFIFEQRPDGTMAPPYSMPYYGFARATGLAAADFDGDGRGDIVVGHEYGITVFHSLGFGWFTTTLIEGENLPAGDDLAIMDVDRDGHPDIVAQSNSRGGIVYFNDGAGDFLTARLLDNASQDKPGPSGWNTVATGDLDGDAIPDLAIASRQSFRPYEAGIFIYRHDGQHWFRPQQLVTFPFGPSGIAIGDFNANGRNEFVVSQSDYVNGSLHFYELDGAAQPVFQQRLRFPDVGYYPESPIASDLDGNGFTDLTMSDRGYSGYFVLQSFGELGPVRSGTGGSVGALAQSRALGDLNGDGCKDSATIDQGYVGVSYARGCIDPLEANLAMTMENDRAAGALRFVASYVSGQAAASDARVSVHLFPSQNVKVSTVPPQCAIDATDVLPGLHFRCPLSALTASSSDTTLQFNYAVKGNGWERMEVSAWIESSAPDLHKSDNYKTANLELTTRRLITPLPPRITAIPVTSAPALKRLAVFAPTAKPASDSITRPPGALPLRVNQGNGFVVQTSRHGVAMKNPQATLRPARQVRSNAKDKFR